ncbi:uncharacterized protein ACOB7L_003892 [Callospermophilus lateralis]
MLRRDAISFSRPRYFQDTSTCPAAPVKNTWVAEGYLERRKGSGCARLRRARGILEGRPQVAARGGRGRGKGGLGASGGDGSAEGRCEPPAAGSHGERPRRGARFSARVRSSAPGRRPRTHPAAAPAHPEPVTLARRERGAPGEGPRAGGWRGGLKCIPNAPGSLKHPVDPQVPDPQPRSARSASDRPEEAAPKPSSAAGVLVPPGRLQRRGPEPPGGRAGPNTRRRQRPGEPRAGIARFRGPGTLSAAGPRSGRFLWVAAVVIDPPGHCKDRRVGVAYFSGLRQKGFSVSRPCWCARPTGGCPPDCPRLRQRGPRWQWAPPPETCQAGRHSSVRRHFGQLRAPFGGVQPCSPSLQPGHP